MTTFSRAIIVHGGAGPITDGSLPRRVEGCRAAAQAGWEILDRGGSAVDAVEASVAALEDDPLFNAGTGSTLNSLGEIEMDAAIMEGNSLRAGAVAAVQGIKNPVKLARRVMEDGRHILLAGEGALLFASQMGIPQVPPESLIVASARKRWQEKHGTVGAVALDSFQKIAVATSTGGIFNKLPGRVGDSPLLGCGTYADETGGVSCTGDGEAIMRILMAKSALDILRRGMAATETAGRAVTLLGEKTGSTAGLIVVDRQGKIGYAHSTSHMPVCWITADGGVKVGS
ncbi:MAG TPA: isoaspartyl peptidase/L-asparaginase [Candidatus Binatia bacterium]|nr:isoaspartyl peptidase/L-asparaginase [Candidatus Binatia bacterium]